MNSSSILGGPIIFNFIQEGENMAGHFKQSLRVLVADDHALMRAGTRSILENRFEQIEVHEAKHFQAVLDKLDEGEWDIFILDIQMPKGNITNVMEQILTRQPNAKILILSMFSEEKFGLQMLRAGAAGFLPKESVTEDLVTAVNRLNKGKKYISPTLAEKIADMAEEDYQVLPHETLSEREFQVFLEIAAGKSLKQIAQEMHISDRTVSTHRSRILRKMNVESNAELTQYAIQHKLLFFEQHSV
ncbi:response regulator [bacterium]|nr:response regulator [bacterium]